MWRVEAVISTNSLGHKPWGIIDIYHLIDYQIYIPFIDF